MLFESACFFTYPDHPKTGRLYYYLHELYGCLGAPPSVRGAGGGCLACPQTSSSAKVGCLGLGWSCLRCDKSHNCCA